MMITGIKELMLCCTNEMTLPLYKLRVKPYLEYVRLWLLQYRNMWWLFK